MYLFRALLISFLFANNLRAEDIRLELGEHKVLRANFNKLWVEDKKIIKVERKNNTFYLRTLKTGITHFRTDNQLHRVFVMPLQSKRSYVDWAYIKNKFVSIQPDYCEEAVCLKGTIFSLKEYEKLISQQKKIMTDIFFAFNITPDLAEEITKYVEEKMRMAGISPGKISFTEPWRMYFSKKSEYKEAKDKLAKLGLRAELTDAPINTDKNLRVSVKFVEINKNFERKLGLRWPQNRTQQLTDKLDTEELQISLNAAERSGEAKILASPNLLCSSGKSASFFAGGEFPIQILGLRSKEVEWKRYGIGLNLKPIVNSFSQISLQIESEVSTLDRSMTVEDIPALHTNKIVTFFDLNKSQTVAISGLVKNEISENVEGIPYLMNLPVLGHLFKSKSFQENKSELIIFVTPEIM